MSPTSRSGRIEPAKAEFLLRKVVTLVKFLRENNIVWRRDTDDIAAEITALLESSTASENRAHFHTCMSCEGRWFCPHPPGDCKAGERVFPSITLRGPCGPTVFHHACPGKK